MTGVLQGVSGRLSSWRRAAAAAAPQDDEALLQQLEAAVEEATLDALRGTSELAAEGCGPDAPALLRRYLAAEKRSVSKAALRLEQQAAWRREFGVVALPEVTHEVEAAKVLLQPPTAAPTAAACSGDGGAALGARPLVVVRVCRHLPGGDMAELERFIVLVLDTACSYCASPANPSSHLAVLFDLNGVSRRNLHLAAAAKIFRLLERRFPERVGAIYLADAPLLFHGVFQLILPFIDATSREKIRFVSGKEGQAQLVQDLGADVVPREYGGAAKAVPIEEAVRRLPAWQQQQQQEQQQGQQRRQQEQEQQGEQAGAAAAALAQEPPQQKVAVAADN